MVLFPNCKINLGLRVAGKRPDGYHNLETIFYPLPLRDAAEITTNTIKKDQEPFDLTVTGVAIPGSASSNICTKAWQLIRNDYPNIPAVRMHLHKAIPIGGGLGGGSSDGAFTLMLLNEELRLNIAYETLANYALKLGSDCPFFILNKPCFATGRGEIMEEIPLDLGNYYFVVVDPQIHVSTAEAFSQLVNHKTKARHHSLTDVIKQPINSWKELLTNDFEDALFETYPLLRGIKQALYDSGAEYASMTGTGSCIYGIFSKNKKAGNLVSGEQYRVYNLKHSH